VATPPTPEIPTREKRRVALTSLLAAAFLTATKLAVGFLSGSLGILSEAAHSGLDLVAAIITYVSIRIADLPADQTHPFGHGKIEHLSAFIQTALLVVTGGWIVLEAVRRLLVAEVHVTPSAWTFTVLCLSIAVDTLRSRALFRAARKYNSQALEADALHFSTDVYSTGVVILGLVLITVARQNNIAWLRHADPIAALIVAGISLSLSLRLGNKTVDALIDAAPAGVSERISAAVSRVPGVLNPERIRVRQSGNRLFVDLRLLLQSNIPLEHAEAVATAVETEIRRLYPLADVVVDAVPQEPARGDLVERVRSIAHRANFQIHDVTAYWIKDRVNVTLDLEVDPSLRLDAAHDQATHLEDAIRRDLPEVDNVNVHIEPLRKRVPTASEAPLVQAGMEKQLLEVVRNTPGVLDCHQLEAHQVDAGVVVTVHCRLRPGSSVMEVHDTTERLELRFREQFPQISQVNIHAEPQ